MINSSLFEHMSFILLRISTIMISTKFDQKEKSCHKDKQETTCLNNSTLKTNAHFSELKETEILASYDGNIII